MSITEQVICTSLTFCIGIHLATVIIVAALVFSFAFDAFLHFNSIWKLTFFLSNFFFCSILLKGYAFLPFLFFFFFWPSLISSHFFSPTNFNAIQPMIPKSKKKKKKKTMTKLAKLLPLYEHIHSFQSTNVIILDQAKNRQKSRKVSTKWTSK